MRLQPLEPPLARFVVAIIAVRRLGAVWRIHLLQLNIKGLAQFRFWAGESERASSMICSSVAIASPYRGDQSAMVNID